MSRSADLCWQPACKALAPMKILAATIASVSLLVVNLGCGKSEGQESALTAEAKPVVGAASFRTSCPYGTISASKAARLELFDCPINAPSVELTEPLQRLVLLADCKKNTLIVRSEDRQIDTQWEVMPDGTFYFTLEAGNAKLKSDGSGTQNCVAPLTTEYWGKLDCKDRDRVRISLENVWWLNKRALPAGSRGTACKMPSGCYFHSVTQLQQC